MGFYGKMKENVFLFIPNLIGKYLCSFLSPDEFIFGWYTALRIAAMTAGQPSERHFKTKYFILNSIARSFAKGTVLFS